MQELTNAEYEKISDYIKKNFGISLGSEKKSLVYSRLRTILQENNFDNFTDYFNFLTSDKSGLAVTRFIDKITTNHTYFMRETDHFDYFRDSILPYIEQKYTATKDVRLWCAGSSSGEEPYTLQMILQDYFGKKTEKWNTEILATDISTTVLDKCLAGIYPKDSVLSLPKNWVSDYFSPYKENQYMAKDLLKKNIIFRKFNLMEEKFPFTKKFQIIFCRNVMIYFDAQTRNELVKRFYNVLEDGGYLFVGHSESLNNSGADYQYVKPAIYRKMI